MTIKLDARMQRMIQRRVQAGRYSSAQDVLRAGLAALEQQEQIGDFAPGELDELIAEGERSLKGRRGIPAAKVFAELRARSSTRRTTTRKSA